MKSAVAAALLVACVVTAAPDAGTQVQVLRPKVWSIPKVLDVVDVPGRVQANGIPIAIHAIRSADRAEAIGKDLVKQFERAGLFIPPRGHISLFLDDTLQVTGIDPDTFIVYTVYLQQNPDKTTTVILTESSMLERRRETGAPTFAPVMPGAKHLLTSQTEGVDLVRYVVERSRGEVSHFYDTVLASEKFAQEGPGQYVGPNHVLSVILSDAPEGGTSVLVLRRPRTNVMGDADELQ